MTPEQLEAHRVRFEQQYAERYAINISFLQGNRDGDDYEKLPFSNAWQAYQWALADAQRAAPVSEVVQPLPIEQIAKIAADKLMGWRLPADFYPDCYISFDTEKALQMHSWPTGTNLLHVGQARAMFEYCLSGLAETLATPQPVEVQRPVTQAEDSMLREAALRGAKVVGRGRPVEVQPVAWVLAPHYRGYALLGIGAYLVNHTAIDAELGAEIVISIATEAEKAGRTVGDERENAPGKTIQPDDMAVRIGFKNVAGLDVLENQLRHLRAVHFPESIAAAQSVEAQQIIETCATCSQCTQHRGGEVCQLHMQATSLDSYCNDWSAIHGIKPTGTEGAAC